MEIARKLLIVYFNRKHVVPRLKKYGNLIYVSRRQKYAYLYIDAKDLDKTMNAIKRLQGVKQVEESLVDLEAFNFSL
ncbi:MAG TPA: DUF2129 domain-containing protein [Haloplasmataceae bacterium]